MFSILLDNQVFKLFNYESEADLEKQVVEHSKDIFGSKSLYFNIKKLIGTDNILTIPDGYLIDLSFPKNPKLYIIEIELVTHDPYKHIGQQLLKFAISYKASWKKIKDFLLKEATKNNDYKEMIDKFIVDSNYRNIDAFFEELIYEKPVSAIIIIDEIRDDLTNVLNQLTMQTDILEFQTYCTSKESELHIHKFTPFQEDVRDAVEGIEVISPDDLDTIVVPANEDGFLQVFIGEDCWYEIRISSSMIDKIKYIAAYQTAPISAITHFAEVDSIKKHKNSEKYKVYFKGKAQESQPIKLITKGKIKALRAPRYTNFKKLRTAKNLDEVF